MLDTMQQRCRPIQLEDRPIIDEIRAKTGHTLSAHAFTSLYLWQNALKLSVCLEGDAFFIRFLLRGENAWFYPCGSEEAQIRFTFRDDFDSRRRGEIANISVGGENRWRCRVASFANCVPK